MPTDSSTPSSAPIGIDQIVAAHNAVFPTEFVTSIEFEEQEDHDRVVLSITSRYDENETKTRTWSIPLNTDYPNEMRRVFRETPTV